MKRVFVATLCCAALFALLYGHALAEAEFCPASVSIKAVGSSDGAAGIMPASLYGFELTAHGARIAWGTIAFDTDKGWYTLQVPHVALSARVRHVSTPYVTFTRQDFVSERMYVRFPQDVQLLNAWMYRADASDDGAFGWNARGSVSCSPGMKSNPKANPVRPRVPLLKDDAADEDRLYLAPDSTSTVLAAKDSPQLLDEHCAEPFKDAIVTPQTPRWPVGFRTTAETASIVEVAINADGSVADAWVEGPSGSELFDDAAVEAAKGSNYKPARAYCQNVPQTYLFNVTWSPN
jgi:TonB family protein